MDSYQAMMEQIQKIGDFLYLHGWFLQARSHIAIVSGGLSVFTCVQ